MKRRLTREFGCPSSPMMYVGCQCNFASEPAFRVQISGSACVSMSEMCRVLLSHLFKLRSVCYDVRCLDSSTSFHSTASAMKCMRVCKWDTALLGLSCCIFFMSQSMRTSCCSITSTIPSKLQAPFQWGTIHKYYR